MALARGTATAQDAKGNAVAGCSIEVRSEDTGRLVQVYADRAGTVALGNPFVAPEATFGFHVEGGAYKVTATKGPFQSIWRYVAIGTASEFDYDQFIYELQAGLMPVATFAEIDGQAPGVDQSLAAIVLADPEPTRNGYYLWNDGAGQWQRKRPLPDTLARLTVVGGTANALEALASPGVDPGAVLTFFIDVPTANTGPVTLSINGGPVLPVRDVNGDDFAPGVFVGRMVLSNEGDQLRALIGGDYLAAVAAAQAFSTQAALARDSSQRWAEGTAPGGAGTKSAREWAEQANPDNKLNKDGSNIGGSSAQKIFREAIGADLVGGFRNKLINGIFQINQRGYGNSTPTTAARQYTYDRWRVVVSGQSVRTEGTSTGNRRMYAPAGGVEQVVEGVCIAPGEYVLNWGGSAQAAVNGVAVVGGEVFTLPGWADVVVRFSDGTFHLPQLEMATSPTQFEVRHIQQELALCQRYYQVVEVFVRGYTAGTGVGRRVGASNVLSVPMRITPSHTVTVLDTAGDFTEVFVEIDNPRSIKVQSGPNASGLSGLASAVVFLDAEF